VAQWRSGRVSGLDPRGSVLSFSQVITLGLHYGIYISDLKSSTLFTTIRTSFAMTFQRQ